MAVVQLSPIGNAAQFFSANGTPLNAGTLSTYAAGTSTPQTTYTTSLGSIANSNPIVLGADGRTPQEIWLAAGAAYKFVLADSLGNVIATYDNIAGIASSAAQARSYLAGLTLSTAGGSSSVAIAAGQATDSTNVISMLLDAGISKTTASWSLGSGAGALDTGVIANATWYHVFLIYRADLGVSDVLISLSATGPTLPTNYTNFRRIGSMRTDGSAHWIAFVQDGDFFEWSTPVNDVVANNPGTAAVTRTLTVPTSVNVLANVQMSISTPTFTIGGAVAYNVPLYLSDLAAADIAPVVGTACDTYAGGNGTVLLCGLGASNKTVRTNTSAQIRSRLGNSDGTTNLNLITIGWIDRRGRDS